LDFIVLFFTLEVIPLMTGCGVPRYARPPVTTPPAYKEIPQGRETELWRTSHPGDATKRGEWWKVFNDPQLDELEEKASSSNQELVAAANNFLAALALVGETRSQSSPTVSTNPSVMNARPSQGQFGGLRASNATGTALTVKSYTNYSLPLEASWEPDFWGRIRNNLRANIYAAQASAADLENVRLSIHAELAADYFELRAQDSLKELLDSTVNAYQDTLNLTSAQYHAGLGSEEAVAQAETQLKTTQAQDTNLAILRAQYEHAIAVLAGEPASQFTLPPKSGLANPPPIPVGLPSELLERRPDIAAAERSVAQANAQIGIARAAYFPSILLSATGGFGTATFSNWFNWPSRFWSVGPSLAETVFDAGLRRTTVQQYRASYDALAATYRQTVLTAFAQVEDNLAALRILSQDIEQQDAAVAAAGRSLQEATVRYKAGLDPYLNVISAQTIYLSNQQTAVNFRMQQMVASVQLIKALGGGWDSVQLPSPRQVEADGGRSHGPTDDKRREGVNGGD